MASIFYPSIFPHLSHSRNPPKLPQSSRNRTLSISLQKHKPIKILSISPILSHQNPHTHSVSPIFWRNVSQKAAVFLIGSLLFLGRFGRKPAMATVPDPPKTNISEPSPVAEKDSEIEEEDEVEKYSRILERNPEDAEALKVVLYGKMKKGRTKEAVKYIKRLIEVEPEEVEWQLLEALSYELMGQLGKAKRLFRDILKERPLLVRALHGLALAMHKRGEGRAVFEMLNKAVELARRENRVTEERDIRILIAQMHVVKGDLEEALKQFEDLVNENPRDFRPHLCQGIAYSLLERKEEADEHFEIFRNLVPDEFPQRGFIDDMILAAKTESQEQLQKDFESEFSYRK